MHISQLFRSMGDHASTSHLGRTLPAGAAGRWWLPGILVLLTALSASAQVVNGTWNPAQTGTQSWAVPGNWTGGVVPGQTTGTTSADTATFGSITAETLITIDAGRNLRSLTFNGTNAAGLYTLGSAGPNAGEALRLSSGGSLTMSAGTLTTTTINAPLILEAASGTTAGTYTIANNATSADADPGTYKLNITGNISGGNTTSTITLNLNTTIGNRSNDASGNTMSGLISNGGAQGGLSVSVNGVTGGQRGVWRIINDANSYTGNTVVTNATLLFSSIANAGFNSAIGAGSGFTVGANSHVKYTGAAATTDRTITGGGSFYNQGSGALTLTGSVLLPGTLTFRGSQSFIIDGLISGAGGLNRTDSGTVFLNNNGNTFLGNISISDGAFRFATIGNKGVVSALGAGTLITLGQNSGTIGRIEFTGANGGSSDRDIRLSNGASASSGNARIDNTVAGQTLTLSGTVRSTSSDAAHVSSLNLTGVGNGVMSGIIGGTNANASATIALQLTKTGTGTWALSGANNYSRGTLISAGTLLVTNTTGSATGTGNVITSGTGTLGGTGIISGGTGASITIASGTRLMVGNTHQLANGVAGSAGYLGQVSNLRLGGATNVAITLAGTLQFDLFSNAGAATLGQSDLLSLSTQASAITLGGIISVADVSGSHSPWRAGTWQLIDWTGIGSATKTGNFTFDFANASALPSGYGWVTDNFLTDGTISINKTALNHTWQGDVDGSWANGANWEIGTVPSPSTDVFFQGLATNLTTFINGDRSVRSLYFSGEQNFVINRGNDGVLYSHGDTLEVLGGTQTFDAQLRISNNTISAYNIVNNGTLKFNTSIMYHRQGAPTITLIDIIFSGTGNTSVDHFQRRESNYDVNIVKNGSGTLTLSGGTTVAALPNSAGFITGTMTVNAGKLLLKSEDNLGGNPAAFNAAHLTLNGGTLTAYGSFVMDDANRGITFGPNGGQIEVDGAKTLTVQNAVTGTGDFEKTGFGTLVLGSASNTHSGTTEVLAGTLDVATGGFTGTGATFVSYGAQLVGTGTVQASNFSLLEGAGLQGGNIITGSNTGNGTLTFTPASGLGTYDFATSSGIELSITSATNQGVLDSTFGGNAVGSPGYQAYVQGITGSGDHDRLVFNGGSGSSLTFSGNITVSSSGFTPVAGQIFNLLDWATLVSTNFTGFDVGMNRDGSGDNLDQFNLPDISGTGYIWDVSQFTSTGSLVIVFIPEPSRVLLLMLGAMALLARRRR
jgi:autotransporter-associated beta strand protein